MIERPQPLHRSTANKQNSDTNKADEASLLWTISAATRSSFVWPKSPPFASFKAPPVPFPSSHMSVSAAHTCPSVQLTHVRQYSSHMSVSAAHTCPSAQLTHSTYPKTKSLQKRPQFISQIQDSDGVLSSENGSFKFHEHRIIPYPVQGAPAPQALAASMLQYSLIIAITRPITPTRHARLPQVTTSPRGAKCM